MSSIFFDVSGIYEKLKEGAFGGAIALCEELIKKLDLNSEAMDVFDKMANLSERARMLDVQLNELHKKMMHA